MFAGTLSRYFARRFFSAAMAVFAGVFVLVVLVDYVEMTRRAGDIPQASAWLLAKISFYRVPQVTERIIPFAMLVGTMVCYLNLSRRLELVIARSAGISAWQFILPALAVSTALGIAVTTLYNPLSAKLREVSKQMEAELFGSQSVSRQGAGTFWARQRGADGQSIINAISSREQGAALDGVTVFTFDTAGHFRERIEAASAKLEPGFWRLIDARVFSSSAPQRTHASLLLNTNLTPEQVRESFATPETLSFWQLPEYIERAEQLGLIAAGYRLQYQLLLARPFLLSAMVLLAASVSLRFFRFGGVARMVLSGIVAGFLLYVLSKVTEDLSKAELLSPVAAAWLPVAFGGLTGFVALLFQEDG